MLALPQYARAPFIAPGRRNRKVHWNRALAKAIQSLGNYEREDWRQSLWLPKALLGFYPKWFASKNKAGCGCCDTPDNTCVDELDCLDSGWSGGSLPTEAEIEMPTMTDLNCAGAGHDGSCADFSGTYILNQVGLSALYLYSATYSIDPTICGSSIDSINITLEFICGGTCSHEGRFWIESFQAPNGYSHDALYQPAGIVKGTALPWSFDLVSDGLRASYTAGHVCNLSGDFIVTGFA